VRKSANSRRCKKPHQLKQGEDYNLTPNEFEALKATLDPARDGSREEKSDAASNAIRQLLVDRYHAHREKGLAGIQPYQRSGSNWMLAKS